MTSAVGDHLSGRLRVGQLGGVLVEQGLKLQRRPVSGVGPLELYPRPLQQSRAVNLSEGVRGGKGECFHAQR